MTKREQLESALARAEAVLADLAINSAKVDANRIDANDNLEKARAYCRQARAALVNFDRSKPNDASDAGFDALIQRLGGVSSLGATARSTSTPAIEPASRGYRKESYNGSRHRKSLRHLSKHATFSPLIRQAIGMLALTLAYLQYYFMDVHLQILSLRSVVTFFTVQ